MPPEFTPEPRVRLPTLRDLLAPVFRHRRVGILVAATVVAGTIALIVVAPKQYESEIKFLVKRERAETIVSGAPSDGQMIRIDVSEDELNSEVEVLKGRDLLEEVARASGLVPVAADAGSGAAAVRPAAAETARGVQRLQRALRISPLRKTTMIQVTYASPDPELSARVLRELARLYLEKHLALHRPPGAYEFFREQTERFRTEMAAAEASLTSYGRREQVVSADTEKESTLRELAGFESALEQTRAVIVDTTRRLADLESQAATTPKRQTTEIKTSDNADLTGTLKSRILDLEMKLADMGRKFAPNYPPVLEARGELAQAQAALARTEQAPVKEETTNQNPTHQWLVGEVARLRNERTAAVARVDALTGSITLYRQKARRLDEQGTTQQDLRRAMKTAEDNYLLYQRKQEEARISDALDRTRIANVVVAEAPTAAALPSNSSATRLLAIGLLLAVVLGLTATYVAAFFSPYLHTPDDIEAGMGVPVLASLSARD